MSYFEVAHSAFPHLGVGEDVIRNEMKKRGFSRRIAQPKPPLDWDNKAERRHFAREHLHWTVNDWMNVLWTDENCVTDGRHTRCWVTRKEDERYEETCIADNIRRRIVLYTDGSKQSDGLTGVGYVAYQGGVQIFQRSIPLGKGAEVFDAEAIGALEGAKSALASSTTKFATNLWVFLDNLEVVSRLLTPFSGSSQAVFDDFLKLEPEWQRRFRLPHITQGEIKVRCVPGHSSIPGNVAADKLSNEACHLPLASEPPYSNAGLKC
ncbi:hypothetical protein K3495_g7488 [Podosphaera aphanis]|nr:hypothetical protein K3495_g7488 [Podosphaera aphanis]